ncbi:MAG: hypothetical protein A2170_03495 [Deltaproteobacteria bacterium RBG_13_53_10]|nr:MAG: hypothetical protein A2170_03495 [Deltaproteobacteria bacterium RBG_13_53_10]
MNAISLAIVFVASTFASIVGSLIGGASLVTIPMLILLGLPTHTAIGTDRFGMTAIGLVGWYLFHKKGMIDYKIGMTMGVPALFGSFLGARIVLQINESTLKLVIVLITVLLLPIIIFSPKMGIEKKDQVLKKRDYLIGAFLSFVVGVYGGFYGVLAGTFLCYVLVLWFSQTFLESAATLKIGSISMTGMAAAVFAYNGAVYYPFGIAIFCGCCVGSLIGVHYSVKLGNVWIKRFFILLVLIMLIKLVLQR